MGENTLDRLVEAEMEAESLIDEARKKAKVLIDSAEEEAARERERRMNEFHTHRTQVLSSSAVEAQIEAEKIRNDGIEVARGLEGRLKSRIPEAVDSIMSILLEGQ
ncbi:MAG: hypothetical protein ACMUHY_05150 [Thermoplasmatota archaeon]